MQLTRAAGRPRSLCVLIRWLPKRASLPERSRFFVALAHGPLADGPEDRGRAALIRPEEIAESETDYIALAHVHFFRNCSSGGRAAFYSGAPWDATAPSAALVTLRADKPTRVEMVEMPVEGSVGAVWRWKGVDVWFREEDRRSSQ